MNIGTILLVILILLLVGAFPVWPYASHWGGGYMPVSVIGVVLVVVLILLLARKL